MMPLQRVVVIVVLLQFTDSAKAKKTSSLTDLSEACELGSQLQVTEAYFTHGGNDDVCTHSTSCKPTDAGDPSAPCFLDQEENVCRAKFRFSLQDLNRVYDAVDAGSTALKKLRDEFSTQGKEYRISYLCVDGRRNAVNPCRGHKDGAISGSFMCILVLPDRAKSSVQTCHRVCIVTTGPFISELESNVLLKDNADTERNFVEYQHVYTNQSTSSWKRLDDSYFRTTVKVPISTSLKIRLSFSDLATVTRLWFSPEGTSFQLSCKTDERPSEHGADLTTSGPATSVPHTQAISPDHTVGTNESSITVYSYVMPVVVGVAIVTIAVVLLSRRKRQQKAREGNWTPVAMLMDSASPHVRPARHQTHHPAAPPLRDVSCHYVIPTPVPADAQDESAYCRSNSHGRRVPIMEQEVSDVYDHTVELERVDIYNLAQSGR